MRIDDWKTFHESLVIETPYAPYGEPVPIKPSVAQLDDFEKRTGFLLPRGYREYILEFGPGKLFSDWDIAAPGYRRLAKSWDLERMHSDIKPEGLLLEHSPEIHHDRMRRCFYFCRKYKDFYGWDPTEVCDSAAHEYAIYRVMEDGSVVRAGGSFREFVEGAADQILSEPDWDEEELGPRMTFEPAPKDD
jgi:hypothetical protein